MQPLCLKLAFGIVLVGVLIFVDHAVSLESHAPEIIRFRIQRFNATEELEWCKGGIVGALERTFKTEINEHLKDFFTSGVLTGLMEKEQTQPFYGRLLGEKKKYDLTDDGIKRAMFGDTPIYINSLLKSLFPVNKAIEMTVPKKNGEVEFRRLHSMEIAHKDVEGRFTELVKSPASYYIGSRAFTEFLRHLIGPGVGRLEREMLGLKSLNFISPMVNIIDAYCLAQEHGLLNDPLPRETVCAVQNFIGSIMACREPDTFDQSKCEGLQVKTWLPFSSICREQKGQRKDTSIPTKEYTIVLDFPDRRPLPPTISIDELDDQGASLFFLFRSTMVVTKYADLYRCNNSMTEEIIPGWKTTHIFTYVADGFGSQDSAFPPETPIGIMARPLYITEQNKCQSVISFRGTLHQFEWGINLDLKMTPLPENKLILVHHGFSQVVNSLMPSIQKILNEKLDNHKCDGRHELYLTGHSLGGALSALLGMRLAFSYGKYIKLHGATFAAPKVTNDIGAEFYGKHVNNLAISFDFDPVAAGPCSKSKYKHGFMLCSGIHSNPERFEPYSDHVGAVILETMKEIGSNENKGFSNNIGNVKISSNIAKFSIKSNIQVPPPLEIGATHLDGYKCKFSQYCTTDGWNCKKSPIKWFS